MKDALAPAPTLLLRHPTVSAAHVAFVYGGEIWIAQRNGSSPRQLTSHPAMKVLPHFSPDGRSIAFSGAYDGNFSVYVISIDGGAPQRLTYHPAQQWVRGWTPDGARVLFASARQSVSPRYNRLFTVSREGGLPSALPMPMAERGAFSPDGTKIAYTKLPDAFGAWKRYRGGLTPAIWIFDLKTHELEEIPHENASDTAPCWIGETIYFLSDRNHTMNLFAYHTRTKELRQATQHDDFDIRSANAGAGVIAYEQAGQVHLLQPRTNKSVTLSIRLAADLPHLRTQYKKAAAFIRHVDISPKGSRAVFEARGSIFTVPARKGDIRKLAGNSSIHCRYPAWSPDGTRIAFFSDESGEYRLVIRDQKGAEPQRVIDLREKTFFYAPKWAPDSKKILFTDKRLNLFYIDVDEKRPSPVRADTDTYDHPDRSLNPVWSPDSKWIAYTKRLESHMRAVFLFELATGKTHQVTDGMSDAVSACFSLDGKHLYFAASTDFGLSTGWLDLSSHKQPVNRSLYVVVLSKDDPSPLFPESDEENSSSEKKDEAGKGDAGDESGKSDKPDADASKVAPKPGEKDGEKTPPKPVVVKIDLEGLSERIVPLPMPPRDYKLLKAADGRLFYMEKRVNQDGAYNWLNTDGYTLHCFNWKDRKSEVFLDNVAGYWVSHDGKSLLWRGPKDVYAFAKTDAKPKPEDEKLNLDKMVVCVEPRAEWLQMFNEMARIERDFLYDAAMHGANWRKVCEKHRPFLSHAAHREDVNFIFSEMIGELVIGHGWSAGGDMHGAERLNVGLLGADYEVANGRYRISRIFRGLNWHPELRAPLTQPGVNVAEGDYILAVNGRPLRAPENIYSLFATTADRLTELKVNAKPTERGARTVTVVPVGDETGLRHWAWVEGNRRKVDEMTGGRVAYVYLPDTAEGGFSAFNRYYFSQLTKEAVIVDERFNGGGYAADYVIDKLHRPLLSYWATREGKVGRTPAASILGPKVMIINEHAGSGGDALPLYFRRRKLGAIVGKRTWGGLVGVYDFPVLLDGGWVSAPRIAIFSPDGKWEVENEGVPPDIEVEMTPKEAIAGRDPQLEKAVEIILAELNSNPMQHPPRPAPANKMK